MNANTITQIDDDCKRITFETVSDKAAIADMADKALTRIKKLCRGIDFDQFRIVLMEALGNALLYGSLQISSEIRDSKGEDHFWQLVHQREQDDRYRLKRIVLSIECRQGSLRCTIQDQGNGFDWKRRLMLMNSKNIDAYHGRGIFIIKNYVDEISWNEKGNEITFVIHTILP